MTDRDRLIKLVDKAKKEYTGDVTDHTETDYIVETLLNEGAILPPCKVGTPLFFLNDEDMCGGSVIESTEWIFVYDTDGLTIDTEVARFEYSYDYTLGKTVFLTKEEAEAKLKEREGK